MVEKVIATLPAGPADKPVEQWSIGELVTDTARHGVMRIRELAMRSLEQDRPLAEQRLIFDASSTVAKLLASVEMEAMRRKQDQAAMSAFVKTVDAFEAQLYGLTEKTAERQRAKTAERPAWATKGSWQARK